MSEAHASARGGRSRRLLFSAFTTVGVPNNVPGLWRHPTARHLDHTDLRQWIELAQLLEAGGFDMLFLADQAGVYDTYHGCADQALRDGIGVPLGDPEVLLSALAAVTDDLGLTFTSSTLQELPFNFARRISTLDHLSGGRVGWNIVTGYLDNAARNFGLPQQLPHDERYRQAEEYLDVVYRLWETSWEDGSLPRDARRGCYADPAKVHPIDFHGGFYDVEGPHLVEPSPQRTPVLFQAGSSSAGRRFAARHAEIVFLIARNPEGASVHINDVRQLAQANGRRAEDIRFIQGLWFVIGSTEEEARCRLAEIEEWVSFEGVLADRSAKLGIDLGAVDLDAPVDEALIRGVQGTVRTIRDGTPDRVQTFRDLAMHLLSAAVVGTPEQIADRLEDWAAAGVDGVNVMDVPTHWAFADFVEHVVPVLQQRGLMRREHVSGTLREKLGGAGPRLLDRHPARRLRAVTQSTRETAPLG